MTSTVSATALLRSRLPLSWLLAVTSTASWQKMFSADPHLGFLSHATQTVAAVAAGSLDAARGGRLVFNDRVNAVLCAVFLAITWAVVISSARVWLRGQSPEPAPASPAVGLAA